jgi:hypothetical protein
MASTTPNPLSGRFPAAAFDGFVWCMGLRSFESAKQVRVNERTSRQSNVLCFVFTLMGIYRNSAARASGMQTPSTETQRVFNFEFQFEYS